MFKYEHSVHIKIIHQVIIKKRRIIFGQIIT